MPVKRETCLAKMYGSEMSDFFHSRCAVISSTQQGLLGASGRYGGSFS